MATLKQAFPSNYLGKEDVPQPITLTIDHVSGESIGQGAEAEEKRVAHFRENGVKPMILNSGVWQTIEGISGQADDDNWGGVKIEVYVDPNVMFGKQRVGGLRVRESRNGQHQPAGIPVVDPALAGAKATAWADFRALNPGKSMAELATMLTTIVLEFFQGQRPEQLNAAQWKQIAAAKFVASPISNEQQFEANDVPF